jgi:glyoxylate reductase
MQRRLQCIGTRPASATMNTIAPPASMPRPRVLLTGPLPEAVLARAAQRFELQPWNGERPIGDRLAAAATGMDAVIVLAGDKVHAELLARLPTSVKALGTYSVGLDHIDLAAASARGLPVFNTPDVLTDAVADLALMLIIAAARHTTAAEHSLRNGSWGPWAPTHYLGRGLQGRRLGLFGMGRIGRAVADRAKAFGMQLHYHSRSRHGDDAVYHATLDGLLAVSDVLCVCAPSAPELRGVLDAPRLRRLPRGALLVNIARGDLIDEDGLFEVMAEGHLGGLGLDVYRNEPRIDPRFLQLPATTLLPHIGSATEEARVAMGMLVVDALATHFDGGVAPNCVNPQVYPAG